MDITYVGGKSFLFKGERLVAINPQSGPSAGADISLHDGRQKKNPGIVNGPGEYEIGGILIVTVESGQRGNGSLVHSVEVGGLNVVYCDPVGRLDGVDMESLGTVDVLVINADDLGLARSTVTDLEPRTVVPFGAHAAERCAAVGVKNPEPALRFSWNGTGPAPKAALLKASSPKRKAA